MLKEVVKRRRAKRLVNERVNTLIDCMESPRAVQLLSRFKTENQGNFKTHEPKLMFKRGRG